MIVDIGKNQSRGTFFGGIDYADENRNSNAVDDFCVSKIDDERTVAGFKLAFALALDAFTAQFVEIVAGVNNSCVTN